MSTKNPVDEFERRMHLSSFVTTLTDAITKMNPSTLISEDAKKDIEAAELKSQVQNVHKKWLDMFMHFVEKVDNLGTNYPIEAILGIPEAKEAARSKDP
ncbi:hypothetical protein ES703_36778 [subsurface metagenome]